MESYIGGIPAYGYEKHKIQDKCVLFKEKETSTIVQRVYEMYDSGKRISEIIKFLYELKVHRPTEYQKNETCLLPKRRNFKTMVRSDFDSNVDKSNLYWNSDSKRWEGKRAYYY